MDDNHREVMWNRHESNKGSLKGSRGGPSSAEGTRTCGRYQGKERDSIRSWGKIGEILQVTDAVIEMVRG